MALRHSATEPLPTSHIFFTISHGRSIKTYMVRSIVVWASACLIPLMVLWAVGSTLFFTFHDDLVASLMLRQRDAQYEYEDRMAALRSQVDHDATRQLVTQRSVEAKLQELVTREADLRNRAEVVARLTERATRLSGVSFEDRTPTAFMPSQPARAPRSVADDRPGNIPTLPGSEGTPEPDLTHPSSLTSRPGHQAALPVTPLDDFAEGSPVQYDALTRRASSRLADLSTALEDDATIQDRTVQGIGARARATVTRYRDALIGVGLSPDRLSYAAAAKGSGGPFVPLPSDRDMTPFARATSGLQLTLAEAESLDTAVAHVPFSKPLRGDPEITSPFGPRVDPFLGRAAMHTGVDLREDTGTEVRATAPGRVTVAGPASGYGTMVEIDHGSGLTTRYAHLSATEVVVGETVKLGDVIGRVGATGRATGPHLHYETRIDGEPVDPMRFLIAGHRLFGDKQPI